MPPLSEIINKLPQRVRNAPEMITFMELLDTDPAKALGCILILFGYDPTDVDDLDAIINSSQEVENLFYNLAHRLLMFSLGQGEGVDKIRDEEELKSLRNLAHPDKHIGQSAQDLYDKDFIQGRTKLVTSFTDIEELLKALFQLMQNEESRNNLITWACNRKITTITFGGKSLTGDYYTKGGALPEGARGSFVEDKEGMIELKDDYLFNKFYLTLGKTNRSGRPFIFTSYLLK